MIFHSACPVCGSASPINVLRATDHLVTAESFEIWQCAACSVRFTQNIPDAAEIGRYYRTENYVSHSNTKKGWINTLYLFVRRFTLSAKRKLVQRTTGAMKGSVLDIGAGAGSFLHEMQRAGWQVEGVEPDEQATARAFGDYGLYLRSPQYLFQFPERTFDAITLWHVLEHVHELHRYIGQLRRLCKEQGRIFIAVPNYTSFDAEHYSSAWAAYDVPRHLYHFSPASMNELITSHGGRIESLHPMWLDSFYVSLLSEKYKTGSPNVFSGLLNGMRSDQKALSNKRRASSVIYVVSF